MGRRRENRLTFYRRGRIFWVAARDPVSGRTLSMSLRETNAALARARHEQLQEAWRRGDQVFPDAPAPAHRGELRISEAVDQFLAFRDGRVARVTLINDRSRLKRFAAALPDLAVRRLSKKAAEDWLSGILKAGSKRTHNQYLTIVRTFLAWCQEHGLRTDNPLGHLAPVQVEDEDIEFLTLAERARVLAAAKGTPYHAMVATALHCGLRLRELRRLRWEDVDLKARTLIVRAVTSKTGKRRQVPMPRDLCAVLQKARRKAAAAGAGAGAVCFPVHVPRCLPDEYRAERAQDPVEGNLKEYMATLGKAAKVKVNWLICRHTFGSLLAQKGVSLLKICKWMGHDKPETTIRHYATLAPGYDKDVEI